MSRYYDIVLGKAALPLFRMVLATATAVVLWFAVSKIVQNPLLPSPMACLDAALILAKKGELIGDAWASLLRVIIAVLLAFAASIPLVALSLMMPKRLNVIAPFVEALRPVPPIAWLPIALVLFGPNDRAAKAIIFMGAFFPLYSAIQFGIQAVPQAYIDTARLLRWTPCEKLRWITFPSTLPHLLVGVEVATGIAWMCVVAAEMLGVNSGLGYQIELNRQLLRLDNVIVYMALTSLTGMLCVLGVRLISALGLPWQQQRKIPRAMPHSEQMAAPSKVAKCSGATLNISRLSFNYAGSADILRNLTLHAETGSIHAILGPSGCGKSTFLKLLARILVPTQGRINSSPCHAKLHIAYVAQEAALFPWFSLGDQVRRALPPPRRCPQVARYYLSLFGLESLYHHYPHEVSGGQRQRAALARAIASHAQLLLLDEPFAHLDPLIRERLQDDLRAIVERHGLTTVLVTHDIDEALAVAGRVHIMSAKSHDIIFTFANTLKSRTDPQQFERRLLLRKWLSDASTMEQLAA
ncbi:MAG: ATP-binding cassette domain-containing protein [Oligoflexia bacterium]|nr:ATP-binding cassette domain-containing protein [Oligoflexia bacterium]